MRVKRAFIRARRFHASLHNQADPGNKISSSYDHFWEKAAERLTDLRFDIGLYVGFVVERCAVRCGPQPNMLVSNRMVELFHKAQPMLLRKLEVALKNQLSRFRSESAYTAQSYRVSEEKAREFVLLNLEEPLSSLFRYCVANKLRIQSVLKTFESAALDEFLLSPQAYIRTWKDFIPFAFIDTARSESDRQGGS